MGNKPWLSYALITTLLWGIWGAFTGISTAHRFPETLVYCVWSITMIGPAVVVLARNGWHIETNLKSVVYGLIIGFLGAGGQMVLFYAVTKGPAYLIFPIISLSPLVTIILSFVILQERTNWMGVAGILLALIALPLFDFTAEGFHTKIDGGWFTLSLLVMLCWGLQAFFMKFANAKMSANSIFFYMTLTGLLLAPIAWSMTDHTKAINTGLDGPWLAAGIQVLNAIGALTLVYAFRYGKAIVVSPLTNAGAPLITAVISLAVLGVMPGQLKVLGIVISALAAVFLAMSPEDTPEAKPEHLP